MKTVLIIIQIREIMKPIMRISFRTASVPKESYLVGRKKWVDLVTKYDPIESTPKVYL